MKRTHPLVTAAFAALCLPMSAQVVGTDDFGDYGDGPIDLQVGGSGFDYDRTTNTTTGVPADWNTIWGNANIVGGTLVTDNGGAKREYNGANEAEGALRANGVVFYKVDITWNAALGPDTWGGLSSYDFGTEKVFFGFPWPGHFFGIGGDLAGGTGGTTSIPIDNNPHTIVAMVDFDRDQLGLWVDPDGTDFYYTPDGSNSCDALVTGYGSTNWNTAVRLASGAQATFDNLVVSYDPTGVGLQEVIDEDGDGLPDPWETSNGLDPTDDGSGDESSPGAKDGPNGALGDPDGDGLNNLQELDGTGIAGFDGGTRPNDPDSDDDGLDDGAEATVHGTDPLNPDSDLDALADGDEIANNSDPLVGDTDGGGTSDSTEVTLGTNPSAGNGGDDPESAGDLGLVGIEFFDTYPDGPLDGKGDGTGWDYDNAVDVETFRGHTGVMSRWANNWNAPVIQAGKLSTRDNAIKRAFHGGSADPAAFVGESSGAWREDGVGSGLNGTPLLYVKYEITRSSGATWGGCSIFNYGSEEIFVGVPGAQNGGQYQFAIEESGTGATPAFTGVAPVADQTYTIVAKLDFEATKIDLWVDPNLADSEDNNPSFATYFPGFDSMNATGLRLGSGGSGASSFDRVVVATTWEALSVQPADGDGDGLPGDWEAANGLDDTDDGTGGESTPGAKDGPNGPLGDIDDDTLTNMQEYVLGTKANNPDTDGDGLTDAIGETAAGTNPLKADTDGDGLKDGDEVNGNNPRGFTSNPTVADTDGDGQSDGGEVLGSPSGATSDPNNPADTVGTPLGLVSSEGFSYDDGPIAGATGGGGFDYDNYLVNDPFVGHTGTTSDWDEDATVVGGVLVTSNDSRASREFNGPVEGSAEGTDAHAGAVNQRGDFGASVVYFKAEMTRRPGTTASYIVSDDFGTWRMAFGAIDLYDDGTAIEWGIEEFGVGKSTDPETTPVNDNQTYTVVGKLDFDGDLLTVWVDPDLGAAEGENNPTATRAYTGDNWSSGVRLNSKGPGTTEWDNLVVAHTWERLGQTIVEPSAIRLIANGYDDGTGMLSLSVEGIPADGDFHLRQSVGAGFTPLVPAVDIDAATPQPLMIPVDPGTTPTLLFQLWSGTSAP